MLNSFDALTDRLEHVFPNIKHANNIASFRCVQISDGIHELHVSSHNIQLEHLMCGIVSELSRQVFDTEVDVSVMKSTADDLLRYVICIANKTSDLDNDLSIPASISTKTCSQAGLSAQSVCQLFPFHVIFDRKLCITQLGASLTRLISENPVKKGLHLGMHFEIVKPIIHMTFSAILAKVNCSFELYCKCPQETRHAAKKVFSIFGRMSNYVEMLTKINTTDYHIPKLPLIKY